MLKRLVILVVLIFILAALLFLKPHAAPPVNNSISKSNGSSKYVTMEYTITKISGNQYYGETKDGKGIHFSGSNIISGDKIKVHDKVICYFDKNDLGKGIVKVEKKN